MYSSQIITALLIVASVTVRQSTALAQTNAVSRSAAKRHAPRKPEPVSPADAKAEQMLDERISVDFQEMPLKDGLEYLSIVNGLDLSIDQSLLEDDAAGWQIPITLTLYEAPCRAILHMLLDPMRLTWIVDDGKILIATEEQAKSHLVAWRYDVADLIAAAIPARDLADSIVTMALPASWTSTGGQGSIEIDEKSLVVRNVRLAHRAVRSLLGGLRRELNGLESRRRENRIVTERHTIPDLLETDRNGNLLADKLPEALYPWTWQCRGGPGTMKQQAGKLEVTQYQWVHDELHRLFELLPGMAGRAGANSGIGFENALMTLTCADDGDAESARRIEKALDRIVTINLRDVALSDAIQLIRSEFGIHCWAKPEESKAPVDNLRVTVTGTNAPLRQILDEALRPVGLDWYTSEFGCVFIQSAETVATHHEVRVHRIQELIDRGQSAANLLATITSRVEPEGWQSAGGTAGIRLLPGLLIVRHNRRAHEQIGQLLQSAKRAE